MRAFMVLGLLISSLNAFSAEEKFVVSHILPGGYVYYDCDVVEDRTVDMLEALGATDINVRCTGGLDKWNPQFSTSARVKTSFEVPAEGELTTVELKGWQGCYLATTIFENVVENFAVENLDVSNCSTFRPHGKWDISFDVLK